jgi:hypothetical protein
MSNRTQKLKKLSALEQDLRKRSLPSMTGRTDVEAELHLIEKEFKALEIGYEQYFMGIERFEPAKERQILTLRLRRMVNVYIPQTDLRFRLQGLAGRMQSYAAYWDRILRLIEEGRYERQRSHMRWAEQFKPKVVADNVAPIEAVDPLESIYRELVQAHETCQLAAPKREQVEGFLKRQAEAIRERFGDRSVDMLVVVENGKPKIKVRARR